MQYAELHCKTPFSFLDGASHAAELVARAHELDYAALAVTDRNTLCGIVRAHGAAKETGQQLIVGAELTLSDAPPVVLWVTDRRSYGRLARLITCGSRQASKGQFALSFEQLAEHADGLIAGVLVSPEQNDAAVYRYRELFGERCYLLAEVHRGAHDQQHLQGLARMSQRTHVPLVAAGGIHYHHADRKALHDLLVAIRHGTTVAEAGERLFTNAERHLKPIDQIASLFAHMPEAVQRTVEIAERCTFSLDELRYEYPEELAPPGLTPLEHLTRLTWAGAQRRYPAGVPDKVNRLIEHELKLIGSLSYEAYFLTVWDLVRFARSRDILCQGRGSAANSVVCFCLEITAVDPDRTDVLFERFISQERDEAPDIDVDFEHERREEVLQYLYDKYGRDRVGMTAVVVTYRLRSAVRDVGKALGLSLDRVDALAKNLEGFREEPDLALRCRQVGIDPNSTQGRQLIELVCLLVGFPRHLSQHVGGMVMTRGPLCELVPIENAAMPGRTVVQWDKNDLDELGILKVDCLSLGMLSAIRKCFALIKKHHGRSLTLATIDEGDEAVYDMICRADTIGLFQIESRAQMSMLPRLRPRTFYDLVIEVAIVRPGPIQGNMVHPYLRRRDGLEAVTYPNDAIRGVLEKTLGVPLFQEQAMRLAVVAAGFTPGQADQLRRAMGAWRRPGVIDQFRKKMLDGMAEHGLSQEFAESVFHQIRGFGEYGFPESHAASFALLVYVSAWLKCHYQAAYTVAIINSQPMGFYAPAQLIRDARDHGVLVLPVDINHSRYDCTLEQPEPNGSHAIRLGLCMIRGLAQRHCLAIEQAQAQGPFDSMDDFSRRTRLSRSVAKRLAEADAFESLGHNRRMALWDALAQDNDPADMPLFAQQTPDEQAAPLPLLEPHDEVRADYSTTGLSLRAHPLSFHREQLNRRSVVAAERLLTLDHNARVRVAGLVLLRQRPSTAKGITFVTLEDETGTTNLVIHHQVWKRHTQVARHATAMLAHGRLERKGSVIHIVVDRLEDLTDRLRQPTVKSRDFR